MRSKFIPNGDRAFGQMASCFAKQVARDPSRYHLDQDLCAQIVRAVEAFTNALAENSQRSTRSMKTVMLKDETRAEAERLIRRAGRLIRDNSQIARADKAIIGIQERAEKARRRDCPQTRPHLRMATNMRNHSAGSGIHVIEFYDHPERVSKAKPEGAQRLELFVDLIPPSEPIPDDPRDRHGGLAFFLRSYTRSPIKVEFPRRKVPMRVVYWGRWSNSTGETGPFSAPLVGPIEGRDWSQLQLPAPEDADAQGAAWGQNVVVTIARRELPGRIEPAAALPAPKPRLLPEDSADAA